MIDIKLKNKEFEDLVTEIAKDAADKLFSRIQPILIMNEIDKEVYLEHLQKIESEYFFSSYRDHGNGD